MCGDGVAAFLMETLWPGPSMCSAYVKLIWKPLTRSAT
jgi:hypothetical protein